MYGVDVITLLSYDQVQYTDEGLLSLTYWTIAGAYIFKGEKNDTSTMIDATVYDIGSRKMLFRAPGVSQVKGRATFVNQSEELRADSREGFADAADDLVVDLKGELERFKEKIKQRPEEIKVVRSSGYTGGGYIGAALTLLFLGLAGAAVRHDQRKRIR
jgi:rhombotail lipoprotein